MKNTCATIVIVLDILHVLLFMLTIVLFPIKACLSTLYENTILLASGSLLLLSMNKQEQLGKLEIWVSRINAGIIGGLGGIAIVLTVYLSSIVQ